MDILGVKPETWFPVITLILGAVAKGFGDRLSDARKTKAEKEARREQRLDAVQLRRVEFQRSTLLDLQNAMQKLARATGKASHEDTMAFRQTGEWGKNLVSEEADTGSLEGHTSINILRVRVSDNYIRAVAEKFSRACSRHVHCKSEAESDACINEMFKYMQELNERIGEILRTLDKLEDEALHDY
ncbi:MAG TPA: hypothetical protein VME63_16330 [Dyella sp.]|uniref:hypothetical protein n=1 Tax=Dyella sp. TaxID=1869338 RepID=UPI002C1F9104|nr:hypothetical protein [Dyella sp.]HTV86968.1 hypothetical protein [Dyella sp.]